ncbi:MAG: hypothetical protein QXY49_06275 [Thermofilaceae archaeon]
MSEEELLKKKIMIKMQRKLLSLEAKRETKQDDFQQVFLSHLSEDGKEMYEKALAQYPSVAPKIAEEIGRLFVLGRLTGTFDAETVYGIFQELGYPIKLETRLVYKKKGETKSISELLKEKR